jgi:hypothetical protein
MSTDIKRILNKKKLTGEEAGKALIAHAITALKNARISNGQSSSNDLFTQDELNKMVQGLNTSYDIKCYEGYCEIIDTIQHLITKLQLALSEYETAKWQAIYVFSNCFNAEFDNMSKSNTPLIITEKQFEEEKQKEIAEMDNWTISYADITQEVILYFFKLYEEKPRAKNPFKDEFDKLKTIKASKTAKECYEESYCVSYCYEAPDGTRSDQLSLEEWKTFIKQYAVFTAAFIPSSKHPISVESFYRGLNDIINNEYVSDEILEATPFKRIEKISSLEKLSELDCILLVENYIMDTNEDDICSFLEEYKALVDIAITYMNKSKTLKYKAEATIDAMIKKEYVKDLAKNKFLDFSNWYDIEDLNLFHYLKAGYAILQGEDNGILEAKNSYDSIYFADDDLVGETIMICADKLKQSYIRANAIICFFSLIAKDINTPELMDIIGHKIDQSPIELFNEYADDIKKNIIRYSDFLRRDQEKTIRALAAFETAFLRIYFDSIEPTEEAKAEAFELIHSHNGLFARQETIIAILEEGGHTNE